jgi:hypothetical protein
MPRKLQNAVDAGSSDIREAENGHSSAASIFARK